MCKSTARCALSVVVAFPVMLVVAMVGHHVFGHGVSVPMPGSDIDLGLFGSWLLCIGVGDVVRRGALHLL